MSAFVGIARRLVISGIRSGVRAQSGAQCCVLFLLRNIIFQSSKSAVSSPGPRSENLSRPFLSFAGQVRQEVRCTAAWLERHLLEALLDIRCTHCGQVGG